MTLATTLRLGDQRAVHRARPSCLPLVVSGSLLMLLALLLPVLALLLAVLPGLLMPGVMWQWRLRLLRARLRLLRARLRRLLRRKLWPPAGALAPLPDCRCSRLPLFGAASAGPLASGSGCACAGRLHERTGRDKAIELLLGDLVVLRHPVAHLAARSALRRRVQMASLQQALELFLGDLKKLG